MMLSFFLVDCWLSGGGSGIRPPCSAGSEGAGPASSCLLSGCLVLPPLKHRAAAGLSDESAARLVLLTLLSAGQALDRFDESPLERGWTGSLPTGASAISATPRSSSRRRPPNRRLRCSRLPRIRGAPHSGPPRRGVAGSGRRCDGATVRQCDSATVRQCDSATVRQCDSATVRRCDGATVRWMMSWSP